MPLLSLRASRGAAPSVGVRQAALVLYQGLLRVLRKLETMRTGNIFLIESLF